jgi:membrane protein
VKGRLTAPWRVLRRAVGSMTDTAGTRDAAQVAYYLVMSFPAGLLLLVWAFSTVLNDDSVREPIVDAIVGWIPIPDPSDRRQIEALLDDVAAGAGSLGWIGVVALLYSASGAIGGIRHAVNEAWERCEERPFVPAKARDAGVTLLAAPLVIVAFGLALSGALASSIGDRPWLAAVAQFAVTRVLPLALLFALLTGLFRVLAGVAQGEPSTGVARGARRRCGDRAGSTRDGGLLQPVRRRQGDLRNHGCAAGRRLLRLPRLHWH